MAIIKPQEHFPEPVTPLSIQARLPGSWVPIRVQEGASVCSGFIIIQAAHAHEKLGYDTMLQDHDGLVGRAGRGVR